MTLLILEDKFKQLTLLTKKVTYDILVVYVVLLCPIVCDLLMIEINSINDIEINR